MRPLPMLVAVLALAGCPTEEEPALANTHLNHDFSAGAAYWDAPWPSEHRRHTDGTVDVAGFPNPDGVPFVDALIGLTDGKLDGFGTTSTIYFTADGPLLAWGLVAINDSVEADSPVFLVGVEPGSQDHGVHIPLDVSCAWDGGPPR